MTNYRSKLTGIWIACAVVFLAFVAYRAKTWITTWRTNYVVGTFQGTFSLDETRVRIPADKTGLVVVKIEGHDGPSWMRSFSGLSPGRAVAHVILPDSSVVVVGVFDRELRTAEAPEHVLLQTDAKQGVFRLQIRSDGRTTSQRLLASGEDFASPVIQRRDDHVAVDLRSNGRLSVGGKAANEGMRSPSLHLELSPSGEILRWEATGGNLDVPVVPRLALIGCEYCRCHTPTTDTNCGNVRNVVCNVVGDSWCCHTDWDRLCMDEAWQSAITGASCTCAHSPHNQGELLPPECLGVSPNCVSVVDDEDPYCGTQGWDGYCVDEANGCTNVP